jgi:hypothetical protein
MDDRCVVHELLHASGVRLALSLSPYAAAGAAGLADPCLVYAAIRTHQTILCYYYPRTIETFKIILIIWSNAGQEIDPYRYHSSFKVKLLHGRRVIVWSGCFTCILQSRTCYHSLHSQVKRRIDRSLIR